MKQVIEWSQGNPGALHFLMDIINNPFHGLSIIGVIEKSKIRGTDLYVLYSDLCGKDLDKVCALCKNCPIDILEDACSRQDYSGRELVKNYF